VTAHLVEPSQLGTGIAVAFVATLYGLALANLVFLPLYGKMRAHIESELRLRKLYLDGLLAISRKETPHMIATRLSGEVITHAGGRSDANAWARQSAAVN
jgi:chemotaxis protein MotA